VDTETRCSTCGSNQFYITEVDTAAYCATCGAMVKRNELAQPIPEPCEPTGPDPPVG